MKHIRPYTITATYNGIITMSINGSGTREDFEIAKKNFRENLKFWNTPVDHIQITIGERIY